MRGNPGKIVRLADDRLCIVRNKQPLQNKHILTLVDEDYNELKGEGGMARVLLRTPAEFEREMGKAKFIGYID